MELQHCSVAYGDRHDGRCAWDGSPLPPLRRRWCSTLCERAWQANHVWTAARLAALARADGRCEVCGDPEDPEVHHDPAVKERGGYGHGCQHHQDKLTVLCSPHHVEADKARRAEPGHATQLTLIAAA